MDRDFADAIISFAQWRDPERVSEVIANVDRELRAKGYSTQPRKSRRPLTNFWTS